MAPKKQNKLKIIPLGGVSEIGKNMTVVEFGKDLIIVDSGLTFPDDNMPGIDLVIPDTDYLEKNKEKIKGIVVTHGHEDHIGAIPYILRKFDISVYGTKLTIGLIKTKLNEHGLSKKNLKVVEKGSSIKLGVFSVEFIQASHSIPDSVSFAITTPVGVIIFTGDFKIDYTPIDGDVMDLTRLAELGKNGVLALLADSTNVERPGYTLSEKSVGETFIDLFSKAKSRIIVATFASNVHRIQQVINAAEHYGRKIALSGRSMVNIVSVAKELNYLKVKDDTFIELKDIDKFKGNKIVLLTTGSQGEPMSALTRMAYGEHRKVQLVPEDTVIISASPIPGNEKTVSSIINKLTEIGVNIIYDTLADVHVSGHACQEELKLIHTLVKPKFFIPIHGEYRHLKKHAELAESLGMKKKNIFIGKNGNTFEFTKRSGKLIDTDHAGNILVDGLGIGDVGNIVLRDRKHLAEDGLIVVVITVNKDTGEIISEPDIISRGFVYVKENTNLMEEAKLVVEKSLSVCKNKDIKDWTTIKNSVRESLKKYVYGKIKRKPMILPVIIEA
ncbi:ribonuclease J [Miniphocaeibacter halophilus]|uniref:Ribonuclease J n=1 Tax=Miniphocaeibacter halophilus TaxID=2931922 RepID=A0AC61MT35_9FIRM|nr:ribonuclease J [Miniphocaeibacter halophilus]QQK07591.1 ribonuclease J [Miniphocaeibacter halophilus]